MLEVAPTAGAASAVAQRAMRWEYRAVVVVVVLGSTVGAFVAALVGDWFLLGVCIILFSTPLFLLSQAEGLLPRVLERGAQFFASHVSVDSPSVSACVVGETSSASPREGKPRVLERDAQFFASHVSVDSPSVSACVVGETSPAGPREGKPRVLERGAQSFASHVSVDSPSVSACAVDGTSSASPRQEEEDFHLCKLGDDRFWTLSDDELNQELDKEAYTVHGISIEELKEAEREVNKDIAIEDEDKEEIKKKLKDLYSLPRGKIDTVYHGVKDIHEGLTQDLKYVFAIAIPSRDHHGLTLQHCSDHTRLVDLYVKRLVACALFKKYGCSQVKPPRTAIFLHKWRPILVQEHHGMQYSELVTDQELVKQVLLFSQCAYPWSFFCGPNIVSTSSTKGHQEMITCAYPQTYNYPGGEDGAVCIKGMKKVLFGHTGGWSSPKLGLGFLRCVYDLDMLERVSENLWGKKVKGEIFAKHQSKLKDQRVYVERRDNVKKFYKGKGVTSGQEPIVIDDDNMFSSVEKKKSADKIVAYINARLRRPCPWWCSTMDHRCVLVFVSNLESSADGISEILEILKTKEIIFDFEFKLGTGGYFHVQA